MAEEATTVSEEEEATKGVKMAVKASILVIGKVKGKGKGKGEVEVRK